MISYCFNLIILAWLPGTSGEEWVTQDPPELTAEEGQVIVMNCSYSRAGDTIVWYRQDGEESPKYLLKIYASGKVDPSDDCPDRFTAAVQKSNKLSRFTISQAPVSDSATVHHLSLFVAGTRGEDSVTQDPPESTVEEGQTTTLNCSYSIADRNIFWYMQHHGQTPKYLLKVVYPGKMVRPAECPDRFSAASQKESKMASLTLSGALVSDSAVYLCAMEPTMLQGHGGPDQKVALGVAVSAH
ncbi:uncharacterized protein LOC129694719 [Leucoraja erinacea]|uniref:uncharacterized protein LOC129694719 n=1 Tax=Leucoraja erinaceus TaxID=7782 RepID=UPI002454FEB5|nr:uncharacterized protein LOC129694719 [Leucoraja erinacea]